MYSIKYDYLEILGFCCSQKIETSGFSQTSVLTYSIWHYIPADGMRYAAIYGSQVHVGIEVVACLKHVRYYS